MSATGTCTYLAEKALNLWFNGAAFTFSATLYVCLDTGTAGVGGLQYEVSSSNGYARYSVAQGTTNWPTISSGTTMSNGTAFTFTTATGAWTGNSGANTTIKGAVLTDNGTIGSGNNYMFGSLTTIETVVNNDIFSFPSGDFTIQLN